MEGMEREIGVIFSTSPHAHGYSIGNGGKGEEGGKETQITPANKG